MDVQRQQHATRYDDSYSEPDKAATPLPLERLGYETSELLLQVPSQVQPRLESGSGPDALQTKNPGLSVHGPSYVVLFAVPTAVL